MNYLRPANALELFVAVQGTQSAKLRLLLRAFLIFWWLCDLCGTCTHILFNLNVMLELSLKVFSVLLSFNRSHSVGDFYRFL